MNNQKYLEHGYTCVILRGDKIIFSSRESGIKPLLMAITENVNAKGCLAVDKIVGKAAALLYAYMGVSEVNADVMGKAALDILKEYNIRALYNTLTDNIINRNGDDICPMEKITADISEPEKALTVLKDKIC